MLRYKRVMFNYLLIFATKLNYKLWQMLET